MPLTKARKVELTDKLERLRKEIKVEEEIQYSILAQARDLLSAGNATFTCVNPDFKRYTYRISKVEQKDRQTGQVIPDQYVWFAGLLTGPDNTADYSYMAIFDPDKWTLRWTQGSKVSETTASSRVLKEILRRIFEGEGLPEGYDIWHAGRCCRCGRKLTVPSSVASGVGPICANKIGW